MKRALPALAVLVALTVAAPMVAAQPAPGKPAAAQAKPPAIASQTPPPAPPGPMTLLLRGLDKITGRPTEITAPIGKPVTYATLTITVRFCYSTPASETPETSAFLQVEDRRPGQPVRRIFSGWMYASSPGLNGMEHPLYDVWVIRCRGGAVPATTTAAAAPPKVASPDSSDKEKLPDVPLR
ncbi:MAG TPA: DUF2155 domain-containing protein [Rhizomicrobium sp.]|nr:DUF2155 domain-containing protein [Rhizomicrobium sp.]